MIKAETPLMSLAKALMSERFITDEAVEWAKKFSYSDEHAFTRILRQSFSGELSSKVQIGPDTLESFPNGKRFRIEEPELSNGRLIKFQDQLFALTLPHTIDAPHLFEVGTEHRMVTSPLIAHKLEADQGQYGLLESMIEITISEQPELRISDIGGWADRAFGKNGVTCTKEIYDQCHLIVFRHLDPEMGDMTLCSFSSDDSGLFQDVILDNMLYWLKGFRVESFFQVEQLGGSVQLTREFRDEVAHV